MKIKNTFFAPCLVIVISALLVVLKLINPAILAHRENIYLSLVIIQFIAMLLPAVFYAKIKGKGYMSTLNMRMFMPDSIAFIILGIITLVVGSAALRFICEELGMPRSNIILMQKVYPDILPPDNFLYTMLAYAMAPALIEEFVFRGIMVSEYRSGGRLCAVIVSSILFSFLHYGFENLIISFFIGALLAFAVYVTGSLWSAVIIRFCFNIYTLYFETQLFTVLDRPKNNIFMIFIFLGFFLIVLIFLLGCAEKMFYSYYLEGRLPPERDDSYVCGKVSLKNAFVSLPFILNFILYIIISIV